MSRAENPLEMIATPESASRSSALYLDLIERCLTNTIYGDGYTGSACPALKGLSTPRCERPAAIGPGKRTP